MLQFDEANINTEVQSIRGEIASVNRQKQVEVAKSASRGAGTHDALVRRLEGAKAELENASVARRTAEDRVVEKQAECTAAQASMQQGSQDKQKADNDLNEARQRRATVESSAQDDLAAFGQDLHRVLDTIRGTRWYGDTPVGPFGRYVKARDGQWANLLRIQIGTLMTAFVISDVRDREALMRILGECGK